MKLIGVLMQISDQIPDIFIYCTKRRRKVKFEPRDPRAIGMYVCGPTVYSDLHVGNARPLVVFDVLFRLLRAKYGADHVTYARNVTDVDDKIARRAAEKGVTMKQLAQGELLKFRRMTSALGCLPPTSEPLASEFIPAMIALIELLLARGHAYSVEDENGRCEVLFDVSTMPEYGEFAKRSLDGALDGARVEVVEHKRNPGDFVLWKPVAPPFCEGDCFDSPWGRGHPGWHLECSAMSREILGGSFDIHGGGIDLVFPHHQNEIAQSRCAYPDESFAQYWMHNGYVTIRGEKMSKSLGNVVLLGDEHENELGLVRWRLLGTHYRKPLEASPFEASTELSMGAGLMESVKKWRRRLKAAGNLAHKSHAAARENWKPDAKKMGPFFEALCDDLNTHAALLHVDKLAEDASSTLDELVYPLEFVLGIPIRRLLGAVDDEEQEKMKKLSTIRGKILTLAQRRRERKQQGEFELADQIRDDINAELARAVAPSLILIDKGDQFAIYDESTQAELSLEFENA